MCVCVCVCVCVAASFRCLRGTARLSLINNRTVLTGHPMMMDLSPELLGRVLDGLGRPIGLGDIYPVARRDVSSAPISPSAVSTATTCYRHFFD